MSFDSLIRRSGVAPDYTRLEGIYEGTRRLDALGVTLPPQVRVLEMVAPFPKMAIDVLVEVLTPEGFILGDDEKTPRLLRRWWQANDLDSEIRLALTEALVQGRSYLIVGPGEGDVPRITAHRRIGMAVQYDHMGRVSEAMRRYKIGDRRYAAHYLPGLTRYYEYANGQWTEVPDSEIVTGASRPAVVPITNKLRLADNTGRSELLDIAKVTDAGSRTLTNLQVAQELLAMPSRYIMSDAIESPESAAEAISAYFGSYIVGSPGDTAGQIPGADLNPIIQTYKLYAQIVSSVTGIPPSMLGISTDNPSSAEAMRVAKDRLIARAEVKQELFGDAIEDAARLALEMQGAVPDGVETLEVQWRDPAYSSASAKTASMLQAHAQGIITAETAREGLQLTPEQRAREDRASEASAFARRQMGG